MKKCKNPIQSVSSAARVHLDSNPDNAIDIAAVLAANIYDSYSHDVPNKQHERAMLTQDDKSDTESVVLDQQVSLNLVYAAFDIVRISSPYPYLALESDRRVMRGTCFGLPDLWAYCYPRECT